MPEDKPLKSAYELAMERLRAEDRDSGVEERKPLTAEQKRRIAELRKAAQAKLAEIEIMHRDQIAGAGGDPDEIRKLEERYLEDRRRVDSNLEAKIARVKQGEESDSDED